jgi:hypothetical protein
MRREEEVTCIQSMTEDIIKVGTTTEDTIKV